MQFNPNHTKHSRQFYTNPLYEQLQAAVTERINSGEWKPEQPLPNESDLAREFGVSSGTMRKALDALEAEGFLDRRQGRGTFVKDKRADDRKAMAACYAKAKALLGDIDDVPLRASVAHALFEAGGKYLDKFLNRVISEATDEHPFLRRMEQSRVEALVSDALRVGGEITAVQLEAAAFQVSHNPYDATGLANALWASNPRAPKIAAIVETLDQEAERCAGMPMPNKSKRV